MITILSMLEEGYESSFEFLAFRQLKGAFYCDLICVPETYPTLQDALDSVSGTKIFMVVPGRADSTEYADFAFPEGDLVFVLGSPQENLVNYIGDDIALHITTPGSSDMMAVCVAAIVLRDHTPWP